MPHGRRSLLDRLLNALGRETHVNVLVQTTRGTVAVPVSKRHFFRR